MKQYLMIFSNASVNRSRYCLMQKMCPHMHPHLPTHTHARAHNMDVISISVAGSDELQILCTLLDDIHGYT